MYGSRKACKRRALQISILPLMGVEICRMVLTPDTVYLIDRYHKQYVKESVDEWQGQSSMDISFGSIQSLFLARPFLPGGKTLPDDVSLFDVAAADAGDASAALGVSFESCCFHIFFILYSIRDKLSRYPFSRSPSGGNSLRTKRPGQADGTAA